MSLDERNRDLNQKIHDSDINEAVDVLIKDAKKRNQQITILAFTIILDVILTFGLAYLSFQTQEIASQAENNKQALVRNCETTNAARANNKELWDYLLSIPADPEDTPRTIEQQEQLDKFKDFVDKTFAPRDCSKIASN